MIEIFIKVIGLAFIGVVSYNVIKNVKPEYGLFLIVAVGIIVIILLSDGIVSSIIIMGELVNKTGIDKSIFASVIKIIGIGYITEYSSSLCEDNGCSSIAKKIQFAGKITIFLMSSPIIIGVIDVIGGLL